MDIATLEKRNEFYDNKVYADSVKRAVKYLSQNDNIEIEENFYPIQFSFKRMISPDTIIGTLSDLQLSIIDMSQVINQKVIIPKAKQYIKFIPVINFGKAEMNLEKLWEVLETGLVCDFQWTELNVKILENSNPDNSGNIYNRQV